MILKNRNIYFKSHLEKQENWKEKKNKKSCLNQNTSITFLRPETNIELILIL